MFILPVVKNKVIGHENNNNSFLQSQIFFKSDFYVKCYRDNIFENLKEKLYHVRKLRRNTISSSDMSTLKQPQQPQQQKKILHTSSSYSLSSLVSSSTTISKILPRTRSVRLYKSSCASLNHDDYLQASMFILRKKLMLSKGK